MEAPDVLDIRDAWTHRIRAIACLVVGFGGAGVAAVFLLLFDNPVAAFVASALTGVVQVTGWSNRRWSERVFEGRVQRITQTSFADLLRELDTVFEPHARGQRTHPESLTWQTRANLIARMKPNGSFPFPTAAALLVTTLLTVTLVLAAIRVKQNQPENGVIVVPAELPQVFSGLAGQPVDVQSLEVDTAAASSPPAPSSRSSAGGDTGGSAADPTVAGPVQLPVEPNSGAITITNFLSNTLPHAHQARETLSMVKRSVERAIADLPSMADGENGTKWKSGDEDKVEELKNKLSEDLNAAQGVLNDLVNSEQIPKELADSAADLARAANALENSIRDMADTTSPEDLINKLNDFLNQLNDFLQKLGSFLERAGEFCDSVLGKESGFGRALKSAGREMNAAAQQGRATSEQIREFRDEAKRQLRKAGFEVRTVNRPPQHNVHDQIPPQEQTDPKNPGDDWSNGRVRGKLSPQDKAKPPTDETGKTSPVPLSSG